MILSPIFVHLGGGPTHTDTFDLNPDAPDEFRGEFKPIKTNVDGVEISEHLPKLAEIADKFTILRGVSHTLAAHELGTKYMITGNRPLARSRPMKSPRSSTTRWASTTQRSTTRRSAGR